MIKERDKTLLKGVFLIVFFYVLVEHFNIVKSVLLTCYGAVSPLIYGMAIAFIVNLIVVKLEEHMKGRIRLLRGRLLLLYPF